MLGNIGNSSSNGKIIRDGFGGLIGRINMKGEVRDGLGGFIGHIGNL